MARALSTRTTLRHCKISTPQLPSLEPECGFPSAICTLNRLTESIWGYRARNSTAAVRQKQGGLLSKAEFWGGCVGRSSSNGWLGAATFGVGPSWGDGLLDQRRRAFRTSPIAMGRRSAKIATRKVSWWYICDGWWCTMEWQVFVLCYYTMQGSA